MSPFPTAFDLLLTPNKLNQSTLHSSASFQQPRASPKEVLGPRRFSIFTTSRQPQSKTLRSALARRHSKSTDALSTTQCNSQTVGHPTLDRRRSKSPGPSSEAIRCAPVAVPPASSINRVSRLRTSLLNLFTPSHQSASNPSPDNCSSQQQQLDDEEQQQHCPPSPTLSAADVLESDDHPQQDAEFPSRASMLRRRPSDSAADVGGRFHQGPRSRLRPMPKFDTSGKEMVVGSADSHLLNPLPPVPTYPLLARLVPDIRSTPPTPSSAGINWNRRLPPLPNTFQDDSPCIGGGTWPSHPLAPAVNEDNGSRSSIQSEEISRDSGECDSDYDHPPIDYRPVSQRQTPIKSSDVRRPRSVLTPPRCMADAKFIL